MDAVTLYAIVSMANGSPKVVTKEVAAERCEPFARHFRKQYPAAVIWCRSETSPQRPSIGDHVTRGRVAEHLPDPMDVLGMPSGGR